MMGMFESVDDFLNAGGKVLWIIFFTTALLWGLILERFYFIKKVFPGYREKMIHEFGVNKFGIDEVSEKSLETSGKEDITSWSKKRIMEAKLSATRILLSKNISQIKVLVALCPLLGLLGTVTGMISVFEVMALTGTGNARLMASGISMATIPTMAGMVAALSGLYFGNYFENKAKNLFNQLCHKLNI